MHGTLPAPIYLKIPISIEGDRFEGLQSAGLVRDRIDLHRKQKRYGFPLPVKIGDRAAWWPRSWTQAWLTWRAEIARDQTDNNKAK